MDMVGLHAPLKSVRTTLKHARTAGATGVSEAGAAPTRHRHGGGHHQGRAALPLAWVGFLQPFEGRWRPLHLWTTCAHRGHRAASRRKKLAACVGSAGLGARARGRIDISDGINRATAGTKDKALLSRAPYSDTGAAHCRKAAAYSDPTEIQRRRARSALTQPGPREVR